MKMINVLITGKNSYIGNQFEKWIKKTNLNINIDKISIRDNEWKNRDLSEYDTVLHLAGIAHISHDPKMEEYYYNVNRDLTYEISKKAKLDGVNQFIFMSSIIVYGDSIFNNHLIDKDTVPNPCNFYGDSKLQAEKLINKLSDKSFKVAIIRPPMIYGEDSKGNYPKLSKLAKKTPLFPYINNKRSMLHIENLCEFIKLLIVNKESGIYFPQNNEYVNTSELVKVIGEIHGKKVLLTKVFNPIIEPMIGRVEVLNKLFGDLKYSKELSNYKENYIVNNFIDSVKSTEK